MNPYHSIDALFEMEWQPFLAFDQHVWGNKNYSAAYQRAVRSMVHAYHEVRP